MKQPAPGFLPTHRLAIAVDCVVFGVDAGTLKVLLIERGVEPFEGRWALPGGFALEGEGLEAAARRELAEETGLERVYLEQFQTFGDPDRDPRGRVVSVASFALVKLADHRVKAATDARNAGWFDARKPPPLAFDHKRILAMALVRLEQRVRHHPTGFELLPAHFTLTQLQEIYEATLGGPIDKRNFRKKVLGTGLLVDTGKLLEGVRFRAPRLYVFDRRKYEALEKKGFLFEL